MTSEKKVLKGYIKTINAIWFVLIAFAVGFSGGVVYTIYQNSPQGQAVEHTEADHMSPQQEQMLKALLERIETNPDDVEALTRLAHLYFDTGHANQAIETYEKSLSLDPARPDVWTDLGVMYRRTGKPRKAIEAFDRAIALDNTHEIALFNKGVVMMHDLQDQEGALAAWQALVLINPQWQAPGGQPIKLLVEELEKQNPS